MPSNMRYQGHKARNGRGYLYYEYSGPTSDIVEGLLIAGYDIASIEVSYPNKSGDVSKRRIGSGQIDAVDAKLRGHGSWTIKARGSEASYIVQIDRQSRKMAVASSNNKASCLNAFASAIGAELPAPNKQTRQGAGVGVVNAAPTANMTTPSPTRREPPFTQSQTSANAMPPDAPQQRNGYQGGVSQEHEMYGGAARSQRSYYEQPHTRDGVSYQNQSSMGNGVASHVAEDETVPEHSDDPIDMISTFDDKQKKRLKSRNIVVKIAAVLEICTIIPFLFGILSLRSLFQASKAKKEQRYSDALDSVDSARLMTGFGAGALVVGVAIVVLLLWIFLYRPF